MRKTIEVHEEDHKWIKQNRGDKNIKDFMGDIIAKYKEVEHKH